MRIGGKKGWGQRASLALAVASLLGGCAGMGDGPTKPLGLDCVDDSPACVSERGGVLKSMMADKQRAWIRQPATPNAYASGVRMFAYRGTKKILTCDELAIGRKEADQASGVLKGPSGAGLTPAQVSRASILAAEVSRELQREAGRRCAGKRR